MSSLAIRASLWIPVAAYAAVIFALSSVPRLPAPPGPFSDKHIHFLFYGGLTVLLVRALSGGRWAGVTWRSAVWAVVLAALYGASDELHQSFVPGRSMDAIDLLADTAGALTAAGLLFAWAIIRRRGATA